MSPTRRHLLRSAGASALALSGLRHADAEARTGKPRRGEGLGPLLPDPEGLFELPEGFSYHAFSLAGERMNDGLLVPPRHDGMACFAGRNGQVILVRNHEMPGGKGAAYGPENELLERVDASLLFDAGSDVGTCLGGTTTVVYDPRAKRVVRQHLSLGGTVVNCAGGPTPWGSWLSCEETVRVVGSYEGILTKAHGWCFEVPSEARGLVAAEPLRAMGRFQREAVAVHDESGIVYQTEDHLDSLLYRFVPSVPGQLARGGRLYALALVDAPSVLTNNWHAFTRIPARTELPVQWVELDQPESPDGDLNQRGFLAGAARFSRGEGIWHDSGEVWFTCTSGGPERAGQIWRYRPSPVEGQAGEAEQPGTLELFLESDDRSLMENCDNMCVAPWGQLVVCEDGNLVDHLRVVTREGVIHTLGRNARDEGELAGACFSPDGETLFVNLQTLGTTLAIRGPWEQLAQL